jgi:RNA recognition motif-containing protein
MPVRLFVGNLPYETTEPELREHFAAIGQLTSVFLPVDRETGRPRGFAFVEFADAGMATTAIQRLNNQPFKGRPLSVSEARAREGRPGGGPGGGPPSYGDRPSRPMGGPPRPMGGPPRPMGPAGGPPPASPAEGRQRNFGPDAPKRGKAKKPGPRRDEGPRGPIPVRSGGRIYDVDDIEEPVGPVSEEEPFDDFAKSLPPDDDEKEGR